jgi:hypothetical protein
MASKNPNSPKYSEGDVNTNKVFIDGREYDRQTLDSFKYDIQLKFEKILQSIASTNGFIIQIEQTKEMFPNPFVFDIAKCIAEASDKGISISAEEIAEQLGVNYKNVTNKMPFVRTIFTLQGLKIVSKFAPEYEDDSKKKEVAKPVLHQLVRPS